MCNLLWTHIFLLDLKCPEKTISERKKKEKRERTAILSEIYSINIEDSVIVKPPRLYSQETNINVLM